MNIRNYTWLALVAITLVTGTVWAQTSKKKTSVSAHTQDNSRAVAMSEARKTPDPFGFLKGNDNGQHKKNKDCACPGTKKGERQRRKEMRNHRKRK